MSWLCVECLGDRMLTYRDYRLLEQVEDFLEPK